MRDGQPAWAGPHGARVQVLQERIVARRPEAGVQNILDPVEPPAMPQIPHQRLLRMVSHHRRHPGPWSPLRARSNPGSQGNQQGQAHPSHPLASIGAPLNCAIRIIPHDPGLSRQAAPTRGRSPGAGISRYGHTATDVSAAPTTGYKPFPAGWLRLVKRVFAPHRNVSAQASPPPRGRRPRMPAAGRPYTLRTWRAIAGHVGESSQSGVDTSVAAVGSGWACASSRPGGGTILTGIQRVHVAPEAEVWILCFAYAGPFGVTGVGASVGTGPVVCVPRTGYPARVA